jgi:K+-H+ exchange-related protein
MQVFLIPVGTDEYEPYFEAPDAPEDDDPGAGTSWFGRLRLRLRDMLREAEAERHKRHESGVRAPVGVVQRVQRKVMRWIVERAAEQRLLWHLRTATAATLEAPDDLSADAALAILKRGLKRDADRHLRWFLVNAAALLVSVALILVPGPNVLGYYFTFTTVGHLLAWRGAAQGLKRVEWQVASSPVVAELRAALVLASPEREARVDAVAERLGLQHLATFFARLAVPAA